MGRVKPMPRNFETAWTFSEARAAAPDIGVQGFGEPDDFTELNRQMFARCVHLIARLEPRTRLCGDNRPRVWCEHNIRGYLPVGVVQLACVALGVKVKQDPGSRRADVGIAYNQFGMDSGRWLFDDRYLGEYEADPSFWRGHRLTL